MLVFSSLRALQLRYLLKLFLFSNAILHGKIRVRSAFLNPTSVETCLECCDKADKTIGGFDNNLCRIGGCIPPEPEDNCDEISGLGANQLRGCEIGRDLRFAGITSLLTGSPFHECVENETGVDLRSTDFVEPNVFDGSDNETCSGCCIDLNRRFDNGDLVDLPDNFGRDACAATCDLKVSCFNEISHRERLGCLVALDFRTSSVVRLDSTSFECLDNATVIQLTDSPTLNPTKNPTSTPTKSPTKNPTITPTKSPTKNPTITPTKSPTRNPTITEIIPAPTTSSGNVENGNENGDQLLIIVASSAGAAAVLCAGILLLLFTRRRKKMSNVLESPRPRKGSEASEGRTIVFKVELPANADNNSARSGSSFGYSQDSLVRHVVGSVKTYMSERGGGGGRPSFEGASRSRSRFRSRNETAPIMTPPPPGRLPRPALSHPNPPSTPFPTFPFEKTDGETHGTQSNKHESLGTLFEHGEESHIPRRKESDPSVEF